uniref:Uncharacterized protein n=1 Tax=Trichuris muris TaxID=70415 RepID=A0A5S6R4E7_TRIMR
MFGANCVPPTLSKRERVSCVPAVGVIDYASEGSVLLGWRGGKDQHDPNVSLDVPARPVKVMSNLEERPEIRSLCALSFYLDRCLPIGCAPSHLPYSVGALATYFCLIDPLSPFTDLSNYRSDWIVRQMLQLLTTQKFQSFIFAPSSRPPPIDHLANGRAELYAFPLDSLSRVPMHRRLKRGDTANSAIYFQSVLSNRCFGKLEPMKTCFPLRPVENTKAPSPCALDDQSALRNFIFAPPPPALSCAPTAGSNQLRKGSSGRFLPPQFLGRGKDEGGQGHYGDGFANPVSIERDISSRPNSH